MYLLEGRNRDEGLVREHDRGRDDGRDARVAQVLALARIQ